MKCHKTSCQVSERALGIYAKTAISECLDRGPAPVSPEFPIEAFGNDDSITSEAT